MLEGGFAAKPPNSWRPFGNGVRSCIGRAFAEQEMVMTVALILQRFQVEAVDPSYELSEFLGSIVHALPCPDVSRTHEHLDDKARWIRSQSTKTPW